MTCAEAWSDFLLAAPADLASRQGIKVARVDSAVVTAVAGTDLPWLNRVIGLGVLEPATEVIVDRILAHYQRAGVRNYMLQVSPHALSAALPGWLQARGLVSRDGWPVFSRGRAPAAPVESPFRIETIGVQLAGAFAEIACALYELPDTLAPLMVASVGRRRWQHYLAFDSDRPIAAGALFVDGNVGWIGLGGTIPSHRNRGAQSALLAQRVTDGIALGCEWFASETTADTPDRPNPAYHNLLRAGFELAYVRPNYSPGGQAKPAGHV